MICRRCGQTLPEGETERCPFCGIQQSTYIKPRKIDRSPHRPPKSRAKLLSVISFLLVIAIVCVLIPFLRNQNKASLLKDIDAAYESKDADVLSTRVSRLKRSFPSAKEDIAQAEAKLDLLLGISSDTEEQPDEQARADQALEKEVLALAQRVPGEILDILESTLVGPIAKGQYHYVFSWKNTSSKTVSELRMVVKGYDSEGKAVLAEGKSTSDLPLRSKKEVPAGKEDQLDFLDCWSSPVSSVSITEITVIYSDDTKIVLNEAVLNAAFGGTAEDTPE